MGIFLDLGIPLIRERIFEEKYIYKSKFNAMAKFYKVSLVVFAIQMSIQFSTSTSDIYRGDEDTFSTSTDIFKHVPQHCVPGSDCSCAYLETFTYSYDENNHATGKCVMDSEFREQFGECRLLYHSINVEIKCCFGKKGIHRLFPRHHIHIEEYKISNLTYRYIQSFFL